MQNVYNKAKELEPNNRFITSYLKNLTYDHRQRSQKKLDKATKEMKRLSKVYKQPPQPFLFLDNTHLHNPLKFSPSHHTIATTTNHERIGVIREKLEALNGEKEMLERTQNNQDIHQTHPDQKSYQTENPAEDNSSITTDATIDVITDAHTDTSISVCTDSDSNVYTDTQPIKRGRGRPRKHPVIPIDAQTQVETQVQAQKLSQSEGLEKLSHGTQALTSSVKRRNLTHATPVIYGNRAITKSALSLVNTYSAELTKNEIKLMLELQNELELTHAEITALSLLVEMENNPEARKTYWKVEETILKTKKTTPIKQTSSSLLDEKLANAEEAIFGEVIEKGVDES